MGTRNQGLKALKKNRVTVKEYLQQNIDSAQKIVDNPKDEEDLYKSWPLRQAKSNLEHTIVSYETLFHQVLETLEKEANSAGQTKEQVQVLWDKEYEESFPILAQAREMISTLTALREEIDSERKEKREKQERDDRVRKEEADRQTQREENERQFALEKKRLELQEISEKHKAELEVERLHVVGDSGGQMD